MRLRSRPSGRQAKQALNASLTLAPMALPLGVDELGALLRHVPSVKRQPHQLCRGRRTPCRSRRRTFQDVAGLHVCSSARQPLPGAPKHLPQKTAAAVVFERARAGL